MSKLGTSSKTTTSSVDNLGKSTESVGKQLSIARTEMEEFGRVSGLALRRFAGFTVASAAVFGFVRAVQDGVGSAISFERELVKISQVTGRSITQLQGLVKEITNVSTNFGVASADLIEVSRILTQAGLSASETRTSSEFAVHFRILQLVPLFLKLYFFSFMHRQFIINQLFLV